MVFPKLALPPGLCVSSSPTPFPYLPASFSVSGNRLIKTMSILTSSFLTKQNKNYSLATLKGEKKKTIWLLSSSFLPPLSYTPPAVFASAPVG